MEMSYVGLDKLGYDKNFIDEVCYLIKFHDIPIYENKILDNYDLEYKRYLIQRCDVLVHYYDKLDKRNRYLIRVRSLFESKCD